MKQTTPPLPGLSPVNGKTVTARSTADRCPRTRGSWRCGRWSGGSMSPAARGLRRDPRDPTRTVHSVADIVRFRMLMIAAGYEDGIAPTRCAPTRCSRWRWSGCRAGATCAPSPPSAGSRACPTGGCCCGWRAPWSGSIAPPSRRFRSGSRSTSTTPSTPSMAASGCACSTPTTTSTVGAGVVFDGAGRFVPGVMRRPASKREPHLRRRSRVPSHWPRVEILLRATATIARRRCPTLSARKARASSSACRPPA